MLSIRIFRCSPNNAIIGEGCSPAKRRLTLVSSIQAAEQSSQPPAELCVKTEHDLVIRFNVNTIILRLKAIRTTHSMCQTPSIRQTYKETRPFVRCIRQGRPPYGVGGKKSGAS